MNNRRPRLAACLLLSASARMPSSRCRRDVGPVHPRADQPVRMVDAHPVELAEQAVHPVLDEAERRPR